MQFKRVESHNVVSDVRSGHLGFSTPQQCADGDTFHGFDNASISWSLMKWHQASERLIECTPLVSSTCVSVPLVGNRNTFVFKVHPVPLRAIRVLSLFDEPGSSGGLFFEYVRIRDILSELAMRRGDPFFWFYEQTAHLDAGVCDTMSRCLGSEPVRCCSSSVVPMRRIRNFWSNVLL
ncbi:hypothetical protein ONE63_010331 [Megalurothrips usitatus]|uniref:Uncharacterized protein n=1 Tax=Megalurothrips usitatus TaxID=439358 RepID=A0AAV7XHH5_9NEOP|nr:hypothetical protein ONE63_010331 [Megalurothrips usitatus]